MKIIKKHLDSLKRTQLVVNDQLRMELEGFLTAPPDWQGKTHAHPFWELIFINQGEGEMKARGKTRPYRSHDLYLFRPFEEHQFSSTGGTETEHFYLGFTYKMDPPLNMKKSVEIPLPKEPEAELIIKELSEIAKMLKQSDPDAKMNYCRPKLMEIILKVIRYLNLEGEPVRDVSAFRNQVIVDKAKEYLQVNVDRNITVQEIAGNFYISPQYFGEIFKSVTGTSIKGYHNSVKMNSAINMLKESSLQIQEIADKLGFESIHYFSRKFKEYFKVPPSEYRQKA